MYFVRLLEIKEKPRELIEKLDILLKKIHSESAHFTHKTLSSHLNIQDPEAWELILKLRKLGIAGTIYVKKCGSCNKLIQNEKINECLTCGNSIFKEGFMFTTDLIKTK